MFRAGRTTFHKETLQLPRKACFFNVYGSRSLLIAWKRTMRRLEGHGTAGVPRLDSILPDRWNPGCAQPPVGVICVQPSL